MGARKKQALPHWSNRVEYRKAYYQLNKEEIKRKSREYYQKKKETDPDIVNNWISRRTRKRKSSPLEKVKSLIIAAKGRSKKNLTEFRISIKDIQIPDICPLERCQLDYVSDGLKPNSASLDRIDPTKGYIPGNVWIISHRANKIKSDATLPELERITKNLRKEMRKRGC